MDGANDIELDDNAPMYTLFSECRGCVDTLELWAENRERLHGCMKARGDVTHGAVL